MREGEQRWREEKMERWMAGWEKRSVEGREGEGQSDGCVGRRVEGLEGRTEQKSGREVRKGCGEEKR